MMITRGIIALFGKWMARVCGWTEYSAPVDYFPAPDVISLTIVPIMGDPMRGCLALCSLLLIAAVPMQEDQFAPEFDRLQAAIRWLPRIEYEWIAYQDTISYRATLADLVHMYENAGIPVEFGEDVPTTGSLCDPFPLGMLEYEFVRLTALTPRGEWLFVFVGDDLQQWYDEAIGKGVLVMDVRGIGGRITYRLALTREHLQQRELFCYQPHEKVLLVSTVPDYLDLMTHAGRGITKTFTTHPFYSHFLEDLESADFYGEEIVIDYDPALEGKVRLAVQARGNNELRTGIAPPRSERFSIYDCRSYAITHWRLGMASVDPPKVDRLPFGRIFAFPAVKRGRQDIDERELREVVEIYLNREIESFSSPKSDPASREF